MDHDEKKYRRDDVEDYVVIDEKGRKNDRKGYDKSDRKHRDRRW